MESENLVGVWFSGEFQEYRWQCSCKPYTKIENNGSIGMYYNVQFSSTDKSGINLDISGTRLFSSRYLEALNINIVDFKLIEFTHLFGDFIKTYSNIVHCPQVKNFP